VFKTQQLPGFHEASAPCADALEWKAGCNDLPDSGGQYLAGRVNFQNQRVALMCALASFRTILPVPAAVEARRQMENRMAWNDLEHTGEERELVYEISWIAELGIRRRFLRSQRKVQN
jgi:hypothetical protein